MGNTNTGSQGSHTNSGSETGPGSETGRLTHGNVGGLLEDVKEASKELDSIPHHESLHAISGTIKASMFATKSPSHLSAITKSTIINKNRKVTEKEETTDKISIDSKPKRMRA